MTAVLEAPADVREAAIALEEERQRALIEGDLATLDRIFDDALIHIHAPGLVHDKAMLMEHVGIRRAYLAISRGELSVRQVGDVAIMVGPIHNSLRNPDGSSREQHGTVTQVLRRTEDGAWRFLNFQLTPIGEEVWGKLPSEQQEEDR
ncbi:nuclear transport factor 2 family protein [Microbacterium sp. NPDC096154]|uniref:nuclear transport factor 2 family protein n=1 Tax=Microbacterium sp. NPDC096154 TaxID=3155549 RepID=UPI003328F778